MAEPTTPRFEHPGVNRAAPRERLIAIVLLVLAVAYLSCFVPRGWVGHDEGMIGQMSEWVLRGGLPHVQYDDPYTGGLTWVYATLFRIFGIDLVNVRWLLFAGASISLFVTYAIVRRFLAPIGSALVTWLCLVWSFPNYFAGLPSWWVLICALGCVWALFRYVETGFLRFVALAGFLAGCAIVVKQTGVYLLVAVVVSLLAGTKKSPKATKSLAALDRVLRFGACLCALAFAIAIMRARMGASEIVYLLVPLAASTLPLGFVRGARFGSMLGSRLSAASLAGALALLPLALLLIPYIIHNHLAEFVNGVLVLPQKRLAFASTPLPPALQLTAGIAVLIWFVSTPRALSPQQARSLNILRWVLATGMCVAALWNMLAHQFVFGAVRAIAALLPTTIAFLLLSQRVMDDRRRQFLLIASSMLAWASLVQFPVGMGIYLCYVMPLVVVAAIAAGDAMSLGRRPGIVPLAALLLAFALFSMNRGHAGTIGYRHIVLHQDAPLNLHRAHLSVQPDQAAAYRRLVSVVDEHLKDGHLLAGPDCPEVYFLTGRLNESGAIYDFLSGDSSTSYVDDVGYWTDATVIVINRFPDFSPRVADSALAGLRVAFPQGEEIGPFEVRWR